MLPTRGARLFLNVSTKHPLFREDEMFVQPLWPCLLRERLNSAEHGAENKGEEHGVTPRPAQMSCGGACGALSGFNVVGCNPFGPPSKCLLAGLSC